MASTVALMTNPSGTVTPCLYSIYKSYNICSLSLCTLFRVVDSHNPSFLNWFSVITQFSLPSNTETAGNHLHPLCQVRQFMKKSFYIQHSPRTYGIEVQSRAMTWAISFAHNITIPLGYSIFALQSPMINVNGNLMSWIISSQKPGGNILTEFLRITVSRSVDARHVPQCRNQTKDDTNRSFYLLVINNQ